MRKKKILKRVLIGTAIFFVLLIGFLVAVPFLFKGQIKSAIDKAIAENVDAQVNFDLDKFSVGIFRSFPDLSVEMRELSIITRGRFEGDTLLSVGRFFVEVDIWDIIAGKIRIKGVELGAPRIFLKTTADSVSNYNIVKAQPQQPEDQSQTESSDFNIKIDHWAISEGKIVYDDKLSKTFLDIDNLNHKGRGDLSSKIYDITTKTTIGALTVEYDSVGYLAKRPVVFNLDAKVTMLDSGLTLELKENLLQVNELGITSKGTYTLNGAVQDMDISFQSTRSTFRELISLIPKTYLSSMEGIKTEGNFKFDGFVKGKMQGQQLPGFQFNLAVDKGFFQYNALPTAIQNISTDMSVSALDGVLENILVDIRRFYMDLGKNPIQGKVRSKGMSQYDIDADITAKINLAEMLQIFPMEGMELKGLFDLNVKAKGVYSDKLKTIPQIIAAMSLTDGYAKTKDVPFPVENINLKASVKNESGKMADTYITLEKGSLSAAGETFEATGQAYNLDDITWDFKIKGGLDLATLMKFYPIEGAQIAGKVIADIQTKGKTSDALASKYDRLNTSGTCQLQNFSFVSKDFPQGAKITEAQLDFTPLKLVLRRYIGSVGKSDIALIGEVTDYMAYLFKPGGVLKGNLKLDSKIFDANEWMTTTQTQPPQKTTTPQTPPPSEAVAPFEVPKNVDFLFTASIGQILYSNMVLTNATGQIYAKDGIAGVRNMSFNMLGGQFLASGSYDSRNLSKPLFDFAFKIDKLSFQESYKTFNTVKTMAPMAENVYGDFSTDLRIAGVLDKTMMPVTESLNGTLGLKILDAAIRNSSAFAQLADKIKMETLRNPTLKDVNALVKIKDGNAIIEPFKCKINGYDATIQGTSSVKGNIDFSVATVIPAKDFGPNGQKYQELTGNSTIALNIPIRGTITKPQVEIGDVVSQLLQEAAKGAVKKQAENLIQNEDLRKKGEEALKEIFKKRK